MQTPFSWRVPALILAALLAIYCGEQSLGSGQGALPVAPLAPPALPPVGTILFGRVHLQPLMFIPENGRKLLLANRALVEVDGRQVSPSGGAVAYPRLTAGGWRARVGSQTVRLDASGVFSVTLEAGSQDGLLLHPAHDFIQAPFQLTQLSPNQAASAALVFPMPFRPCGMTPGEVCDESVPRAKASNAPTAQVKTAPSGAPAAEMCAPGDRKRGVPTRITVGPRGTYPAGGETLCEDKNGPLSGTGIHELQYLGSTCDSFVRDGCCPNERLETDIEYNLKLLADVATGAFIGNLLGIGDNNLSQPIFSLKDVNCVDNHRGNRFCQEVSPNDLACDIQGQIVRDSEVVIVVTPGEVVPFVIHNNTCYGDTRFEQTENSLGGRFDGEAIVGDKIAHYEPSRPTFPPYFADRNMTYTAPAVPADFEAIDSYEFSADRSELTVTFRIVPEEDGGVTTPVADPAMVTLDSSTIADTHTVGSSPCPDPLPELTFRNIGSGDVTVTASVDNLLFRVAGTNPQTVPPGPGSVQVLFDCGQQPPQTGTLRIEVRNAAGQVEIFNVPVTLTRG